MGKNEILEILKDWNFWDRDLRTGMLRPAYLKKLKRFSITNYVVAVLGPRRAGKSFIIRQFVKALIDGGVERRNTLIVNFEDSRFPEIDAKMLQTIYEVYIEAMKPSGTPYIFLDEVQKVKDWEKWVRTAHELERAKVVLSGSNSGILGADIGARLTGRSLVLNVLPLSFAEFIDFRKKDAPAPAEEKGLNMSFMLREYFEHGGFPEVVLNADIKKEILLNYFADIMEKDIIGKYGVRKSGRLKNLARYYMSNQGGEIKFKSMGRHVELTGDTVEKFSNYFEEVYLVKLLKQFSFKVKEQDKSPKKVYAYDTGLANAVGFKFSGNIGRNAENAVFIELLRRKNDMPETGIFYWKDSTHNETDFIIQNGPKVAQAVQVSWDIGSLDSKAREEKGLLKAMKIFGLKQGEILNLEVEKEEKADGYSIRYTPLWKWFLGTKEQ